jgi:hypothetical protein
LGDNSLKLGLGLWNNAIATYSLEALLILVGSWIYLAGTRGESFTGKYGMIIFTIFLVLFNLPNIFGPPLPGGTLTFALIGLTLNFVFAGVAFWLDQKRISR